MSEQNTFPQFSDDAKKLVTKCELGGEPIKPAMLSPTIKRERAEQRIVAAWFGGSAESR